MAQFRGEQKISGTIIKKRSKGSTKKDLSGLLGQFGDIRNNVTTFSSVDVKDPLTWTDMSTLTSGETISKSLSKITTMVKNVRYIYDRIDEAVATYNSKIEECYDACIQLGVTPKSSDPEDIASSLKELYDIKYQQGLEESKVGTATADKVLYPYTFTSAGGVGIEGTLRNRGDLTINKIGTYGAGYYSSINVKTADRVTTYIGNSVSTLPYNLNRGRAVVYNDEIHIFGSRDTDCRLNHYKYNSKRGVWSVVSVLPYNFYDAAVVVFNNEIHLLGSRHFDNGYIYDRYHYKYNNNRTWSQVSTLPYEFCWSCAVEYNGELHILGSDVKNCYNLHYKYNADRMIWSNVSTLPTGFYRGSTIVHDNEIHIIGSGNNYRIHYKYNGTLWSQVSTLPYNFYDGAAVVYNDEIHIMGSGYTESLEKSHYRLDKTKNMWVEVQPLPYNFIDSPAVVYDNYIQILGSTDSTYYRAHYNVCSTKLSAGWVYVES